MKLNRLAQTNTTVIETGEKTMLYSYSTLVALHIQGVGYYRTTQHYSTSTTRHINRWLTSEKVKHCREVSQEELESLAIAEVPSINRSKA